MTALEAAFSLPLFDCVRDPYKEAGLKKMLRDKPAEPMI